MKLIFIKAFTITTILSLALFTISAKSPGGFIMPYNPNYIQTAPTETKDSTTNKLPKGSTGYTGSTGISGSTGLTGATGTPAPSGPGHFDDKTPPKK